MRAGRRASRSSSSVRPISARIRAKTWRVSATGGLTSARWNKARGSNPAVALLPRRRTLGLHHRRAGISPSAGLTDRRIGVRLDGERGEEVVEGLVRAFGIAVWVEVHEQAADDGKHDGGQLGPAEAAHAVL